MNNSIMHRLIYNNPPKYKTHNLYREYLRKSTSYCCAYCTLSESESPGATFNIDHFKPKTLFPDLVAECENLRYSCPRCNSYKGDLWISETLGCLRDCKSCTNKLCHTNIERFIDTLTEDPAEAMYLGKDDKIYAMNGSFPAKYTIKYLRLNRVQLIKVRHVRRFIDDWFAELSRELKCKGEKFRSIEEEYSVFLKSRNIEEICMEGKDKIYFETICIMYEMIILQIKNSIMLIRCEIDRLKCMIDYRFGNDEIY